MMDKGRGELQNQVGNQDENISTGQNSKNIKGEEEGLETGAERAKVPPTGFKEKVTELGWQARPVLSRLQGLDGSRWKDKVIGARRKGFSNSGWMERGNISSVPERATKMLF